MQSSFFLLCFCLQTGLAAQNLVPNPSFEKHKQLPSQFMPSAADFNRSIKDWAVPNSTTPDYITVGFLQPGLFGTSHTKLGMVGMAIASEWAETIYAKLDQELEANTTYWIEFWIKRPAQNFMDTGDDCLPGYVSPDFGILLSDTLQTLTSRKFIKGVPQLRCGERFWVGKDWIKVGSYYTTDKNYRYVYAGQFRPPGNNDPLAGSGYVLIDDILIKELTFSDQFAPGAPIRPGAIIPLEQVCFDSNKAEILPSSFAALDTLVGFLNANNAIKVRINGHTDNEGTAEHNQELSALRAGAVSTYLITKGIDQKRVSWQGFGETKPKADNATAIGKQKNRRVEFEIVGM